jgi:hypothetical protein
MVPIAGTSVRAVVTRVTEVRTEVSPLVTFGGAFRTSVARLGPEGEPSAPE